MDDEDEFDDDEDDDEDDEDDDEEDDEEVRCQRHTADGSASRIQAGVAMR